MNVDIVTFSNYNACKICFVGFVSPCWTFSTNAKRKRRRRKQHCQVRAYLPNNILAKNSIKVCHNPAQKILNLLFSCLSLLHEILFRLVPNKSMTDKFQIRNSQIVRSFLSYKISTACQNKTLHIKHILKGRNSIKIVVVVFNQKSTDETSIIMPFLHFIFLMKLSVDVKCRGKPIKS